MDRTPGNHHRHSIQLSGNRKEGEEEEEEEVGEGLATREIMKSRHDVQWKVERLDPSLPGSL